MRNPLLPITAAFAAGIWTAPYFYLSAPEQLFFMGLILLGAALLLRWERYSYGLALSLGGFVLCGTFLAAEEHSFLPPQHIESLARRGVFHPEQPSQAVGWARTSSVLRPGGEYFDLELTEVRQAGRVLLTKGQIRLYRFANPNSVPPPKIAYGTRLALSLRDLRRPRNFLTPGFFDYEAYLRRRGIYFTGLVRNISEVEVLPGQGGSRWRGALDGFRVQLLSHLDLLYPAPQSSSNRRPILKAMLLGDDNWLSPETELAFQESGAYHVLVVSGLHVGALAVGLFWLFSALRLSHWLTMLLVAVAVIAFAVLAGSGIPVMRAALMVLIYLAARFLYRERVLPNSIAAAALALLVLHPSDLRDSSFQLSFLAVLVLAAIAIPIVQWTLSPFRLALRDLENKELDMHLKPKQTQFRQDIRILLDFLFPPVSLDRQPRSRRRWLLAKTISGLLALTEAIVFTLFMQLGFALVMAAYFHRVAWSGILANLVVLSLTSVLIPLGFLVLLASLLWWPLAKAGAWALGILVFWLYSAVDWSAQLHGLNLRVPTPPLWVSVCFLATLFLLALAIERRSRWTWAAVAVLFSLAIVLTLSPYSARLPQGKLEVTTLDVGQGDSLFIAFPNGSTMLVDGGGAIPVSPDVPPSLYIGESVVSPALWSRQIQTLDFVVLTHAHWDHLGGLLTVLQNFRVRELWIGPSPRPENLQRLLDLAASRSVRVVRQQSGNRREIDGVELEVLSPPADWNPRRVSNNDSLVLRLQYGQRRVLLPGDVESRMERRLVENGNSIAGDILKIPHHGSKTSTTPAFLARVAPSFGIISVGAFGRFGHPHAEVLETLRQAGVRTMRTDQDGSVTILTDGRRIELATFREALRSWPPFPLF
ncbi:MAG: ComEC/Rec2 family competence protein [Acidobacteria bacterium]|nr:ComEC/Rec2 family competence protein [Acidobacteriota bacterium]